MMPFAAFVAIIIFSHVEKAPRGVSPSYPPYDGFFFFLSYVSKLLIYSLSFISLTPGGAFSMREKTEFIKAQRI